MIPEYFRRLDNLLDDRVPYTIFEKITIDGKPIFSSYILSDYVGRRQSIQPKSDYATGRGITLRYILDLCLDIAKPSKVTDNKYHFARLIKSWEEESPLIKQFFQERQKDYEQLCEKWEEQRKRREEERLEKRSRGNGIHVTLEKKLVTMEGIVYYSGSDRKYQGKLIGLIREWAEAKLVEGTPSGQFADGGRRYIINLKSLLPRLVSYQSLREKDGEQDLGIDFKVLADRLYSAYYT